MRSLARSEEFHKTSNNLRYALIVGQKQKHRNLVLTLFVVLMTSEIAMRNLSSTTRVGVENDVWVPIIKWK